MKAGIGGGLIIVALVGGLSGGYFLWEMTVFGPAIEDLDSRVMSSQAELIQTQEELSRARTELAELLAKPDISLIDIGTGIDQRSCYYGGFLGFGDQFDPEAFASIASVEFTIINTSEVDGFANVEMMARGQVLSSNRYFVDADSREIKTLIVDNVRCAMNEGEITIRIAGIEPA